jgi:hypothetical protein
MARPDAEEVQLNLIRGYLDEVELYSGRQPYFRKHCPPRPIAWTYHATAFIPAGAQAIHRNLSDTKVPQLDTKDFARETHVDELAALPRDLFDRILPTKN